MITIKQSCAIILILFQFSILSTIISVPMMTSSVYAIEVTDKNSNIKVSSSFNYTSDDANQSSTDTPMMKMMERGDIAMGFNQNRIAHQFVATPVGGKITITALNGSDSQTISQIKNHILDIQKEFSEGNFTKPFFIHGQEVPGTKVMLQKKDLIKYDILQMNNGSSLLLTTNDKELIDAINQFMEFQTREHYGH